MPLKKLITARFSRWLYDSLYSLILFMMECCALGFCSRAGDLLLWDGDLGLKITVGKEEAKKGFGRLVCMSVECNFWKMISVLRMSL